MNAFQIISKKLLNIDDDKNFLNNNNPNYLSILWFYIFIKKEYTIVSKYYFFDETIQNKFVSKEMREEFIELFCKIQKIYRSFSKLAYLYKYKKANTVIEYDLCLNKIKENEKNVFVLLQNDNKYLFNICDLIKIIHNSIANTNNFFNNPLTIKNPYNNLIINKSTLYNIYFFVRQKTLLNPDLLFYFFKSNFDINIFTQDYKVLIRNYAINNYIRNSPLENLYEDVNKMLDCFNFNSIAQNKKINIHENFPKDKLVEIMIPYLKLYYLSEFSFIHISGRNKYKKILRSKLNKFQKFNPKFGRKIYEFYNILQNNRTIKKIKGVFNYNYKKFNDKNKEKKNFMNSHDSNFYRDSENESENESDTEIENDDDELTVVQSLENRFININNNLYLINEYTEEDSESDSEEDVDQLNNNIINNINVLNNSLFDIDSDFNDVNNEINNDDDSIS
jgi:hypothetical protein